MKGVLDEDVVERRITEEYGETTFGLVDYRFGGILGIDGALNLSARRPAPEFLVGLEAGYESGFGLVTGFNVGLRVGAGGS